MYHEAARRSKLRLGLKDVRLVVQAAESLNVPLPLASLVRDRFISAWLQATRKKFGPQCHSCLPKRPGYDRLRLLYLVLTDAFQQCFQVRVIIRRPLTYS